MLKLYYLFLVALICIAGILAFLSASQIHFVPFVGNVQYFCASSGSEYMMVKDAVVPHLKPDNGLPVPCAPSRLSI